MRYLMILSLVLTACGAGQTVLPSEDSGVSDLCGNTVIDTGEACDGQNLASLTCVSLGFGGGELRCDSTCQLDVSACEDPVVVCGNGVVEETEVCDGTNLGEATCTTQGFAGGFLDCGQDCATFDVSGCWNAEPECGNGVLEPGEMCDDGNHVLTDNCPDGPLGTCLLASCGDGFVEVGVEECDDGNHSTADDCPDGPSGSCVWASCGDGFVHGLEEACDPATDPSCHPDCQGRCGDGMVDEPYEFCDDGSVSDGCYDDCSGFCGDGIIHDGVTVDPVYQQVFPDHGEECDGGPLCNPDCTVAYCGDGICTGDEVNNCNQDCDCYALGGIPCAWGGCCYAPPTESAQCCQYGCVTWNGWVGTENCGSCGNTCATGVCADGMCM